ncbi:uncharacterized protein J3D65DRAFT_457143 [Phyllosticta citribraziliensis]|uniref:C2H2-type domain-containing protein n=1 Tax=Phyllosticta citribraziliensis TaxID=989973 RepID=A0ABR1LF10_9PEZI
MPCADANHFDEAGVNRHYWPPEGPLRVWPCERECGYCGFRSRDSSQLRSHVREVHVGQDYPKVTVMVGQRRPPLFDSAIHSTVHLKAQYEGKAPLKEEKRSAGQTKPAALAKQEDESKESLQDETETSHLLEPGQSNETTDGPSASVKTRPRNVQVTEKAAAAAVDAADGLNRKRKRQAPIKSHPHETYPSRISPKTNQTYTGTPEMNGTDSTAYTRESTATNGRAVNGHDPNEKLYANITNNVAGLLEIADAAGLDKLRVYDAANDALKKFLFAKSNSKDQ